jgi:multidrug resistance efflux pump
LRLQIAKLEALADEDLTEAIAAKRERLKNLRQRPSDRQRAVLSALADSSAWEQATTQELRAIYLEFVARVDADRGQAVSVRLRL